MVVLNAHYDGRVTIPDTPPSIPTDQPLRISIEVIPPPPPKPNAPNPNAPDPDLPGIDFLSWIGKGLQGPSNPNPRFLNDDALWDRSLESAPDSPDR